MCKPCHQLRNHALRIGGSSFWRMRFFRRRNDEDLDPQQLADRAQQAQEADPAAPSTWQQVGGFRMPVEDVFSITGRGTVVTGRIEAGTVEVCATVTIARPDGQTVRTEVTGVEMFRKMVQQANAGDKVGVLLRGVKRESISRGDVLTG